MSAPAAKRGGIQSPPAPEAQRRATGPAVPDPVHQENRDAASCAESVVGFAQRVGEDTACIADNFCVQAAGLAREALDRAGN